MRPEMKEHDEEMGVPRCWCAFWQMYEVIRYEIRWTGHLLLLVFVPEGAATANGLALEIIIAD